MKKRFYALLAALAVLLGGCAPVDLSDQQLVDIAGQLQESAPSATEAEESAAPVVDVPGVGDALGDIGGVGSDLGGHDALLHIVHVGQSQMLGGRMPGSFLPNSSLFLLS